MKPSGLIAGEGAFPILVATLRAKPGILRVKPMRVTSRGKRFFRERASGPPAYRCRAAR